MNTTLGISRHQCHSTQVSTKRFSAPSAGQRQIPVRFQGDREMAKGLMILGLVNLALSPIVIPATWFSVRAAKAKLNQEFNKLTTDQEKVAFLKEALTFKSKQCTNGSIQWGVAKLAGVADEYARGELILLALDSVHIVSVGTKKTLKTLIKAANTVKNPGFAKDLQEAAQLKQQYETMPHLTTKASYQWVDIGNRCSRLKTYLEIAIPTDKALSALQTEPEKFALVKSHVGLSKSHQYSDQSESDQANIQWGLSKLSGFNSDKQKSEVILLALEGIKTYFYHRMDLFKDIDDQIKAVSDPDLNKALGELSAIQKQASDLRNFDGRKAAESSFAEKAAAFAKRLQA